MAKHVHTETASFKVVTYTCDVCGQALKQGERPGQCSICGRDTGYNCACARTVVHFPGDEKARVLCPPCAPMSGAYLKNLDMKFAEYEAYRENLLEEWKIKSLSGGKDVV